MNETVLVSAHNGHPYSRGLNRRSRPRMVGFGTALAAATLLLASCTNSQNAPTAQAVSPTPPFLASTSPAPPIQVPVYRGIEKRLSVAASSQSDRQGDAQTTGSPAEYAEIVSASVEGDGENIVMTLIMSGELPETFPNEETHLIVAWNLAGDKKHPTAGFTAQSSPQGWRISAGLNSDTVPFPGTYEIDDRAIVMTVPWPFVKGPHPFDWSTAVTWLGGIGEDQSSSADNIVNGHFPSNKKRN